jgi:hypothetical protein
VQMRSTEYVVSSTTYVKSRLEPVVDMEISYVEIELIPSDFSIYLFSLSYLDSATAAYAAMQAFLHTVSLRRTPRVQLRGFGELLLRFLEKFRRNCSALCSSEKSYFTLSGDWSRVLL